MVELRMCKDQKFRCGIGQLAVLPPLSRTIWLVMNDALLEARNTMAQRQAPWRDRCRSERR